MNGLKRMKTYLKDHENHYDIINELLGELLKLTSFYLTFGTS